MMAMPATVDESRSCADPEDLARILSNPGEVLRRGSWKKPEVRRVAVTGGHVIVKDWRGTFRWLRPLARYLARREQGLYRLTGHLEAVPSMIGAGDRVLVIESVEGLRISQYEGRPEAPAVARAFAAAVASMHAAGVFHMDLRKRDNTLVEGDGTVHLIDFTSGAAPARYGILAPAVRWLGRLLDRYAVLKWTSLLAPDHLTAADRRLLHRLDRWRPKRRRG